MFQFLFNCIKNFGILSGIAVYLRLKIFGSTKFYLPGLKAPIYIRQNRVDLGTFREIFIRKEYDIALPAGFDPEVIIDAGANIGFTSLFFSKRFPNARIFSMEPNAENFALLKKNTADYPNITPIQKALYDREGTISLEDKGFGVRGYMVNEVEETTSGELLPATTLPALMRDYKIMHIDILKMDIEGSEKEVFEYEAATWLPITSHLVVELHDRMKPGCSKSVFKALHPYQFSCNIRGENLVFVNEGNKK